MKFLIWGMEGGRQGVWRKGVGGEGIGGRGEGVGEIDGEERWGERSGGKEVGDRGWLLKLEVGTRAIPHPTF